MRKDSIETRQCKCFTTDFELEYFLVEHDNSPEANLRYGVEIQKSVDGKVQEVACEYDVFSTKNRGEQFIQVLAENTVTPATLHDVIEDLA